MNAARWSNIASPAVTVDDPEVRVVADSKGGLKGGELRAFIIKLLFLLFRPFEESY